MKEKTVLLQLLLLVGILKLCLGVNNSLSFLPTADTNITFNNVLNNNNNNVLTFSPPGIDGLVQGQTQTVYFNYSGDFGNVLQPMFQVQSADDSIAKVVAVKNANADIGNNSQLFSDPNNIQFQYKLAVSGEFMGRTSLIFMIPEHTEHKVITHNTSSDAKATTTTGKYSDDKLTSDGVVNWREIPSVYDVSVVRSETWVDYMFIGVVTVVVLCANVFMGIKIELEVVKEVLKKPFAPGIGFVCQFIFMPLVAYGIARVVGLEGGQALGFFAVGCAPGGGASNMYTYILGGDVSLSVTMTLVSTVASFGMIPLWLYTLGQHFIHDRYNISIPFSTIFMSLLGIIIPVGIGMLIQRKKPNLVVKLVKYLKPVFIILIIFLFTFGVWINRYIFKLFTPKILIAGCLLPYIGFILSGTAATICRQPFHRIITIIIETGIQNTGIPIILMRFSLPQPEAALSLISPVVVAMFTPFPLWIAFLAREIYRRRCKKEKDRPFDFQPVQTDSDATPDDDAMDLDSVITFDTSGGSFNDNKVGRQLPEEDITRT